MVDGSQLEHEYRASKDHDHLKIPHNRIKGRKQIEDLTLVYSTKSQGQSIPVSSFV